MKKLNFIIAVVVAVLLVTALNGYSYSIKIKVNGLKDSTCYLGHYFGQKQYTPVDTAKADAAGNLLFSKKKTLKEGVYLVIIPGTYFEVVIGSEQDIKIETDTSDLIGKMTTKGSLENELFYNFQKYMIEKSTLGRSIADEQKRLKNPDSIKVNKEKLTALQNEIKTHRNTIFKQHANTLTVKLLKAAEEPEVPDFKKADGVTVDSLKSYMYYKEHYFDNYDFSDERMLRTPIFIPRIDKYMKEMTVQIPDSIIKSADILIKKSEANKEIFKYCVSTFTNTYETSNMMGMDAVFVHLAKNYYLKGKCYWADTSVIRKIKERVEIIEPLLIGKVCPDTYCADTSGNYLPLHTVKGKYVVLAFWDADCGHCQKEIPKLFTIYNEKLKAKGAVVYAATIERDNKSWTKFLREKKMFAPGWFNVRDQFNHTDFHKTFDVYSTPVIYILDEKKKIIAKRIGVEQITEFLENYEKSKKVK